MGAMARIYPRYREPDSTVDPKRPALGIYTANVIHVAAERGLLGLACGYWIWLPTAIKLADYRRLGPESTGAKAWWSGAWRVSSVFISRTLRTYLGISSDHTHVFSDGAAFL